MMPRVGAVNGGLGRTVENKVLCVVLTEEMQGFLCWLWWRWKMG